MAAHSHQHKRTAARNATARRYTKTHGEIIFTAGVQDQPLTDAFPLTTGMNRNAANPSAFSVAARAFRRAPPATAPPVPADDEIPPTPPG
jgi:hypothetical protein